MTDTIRNRPGPRPKYDESMAYVTVGLPPRVWEWLKQTSGMASDGVAAQQQLIEMFEQVTGEHITRAKQD